MSSALAKILKKTTHLQDNQEVPLFAMSYISDFDLKLSASLASALTDSIKSHLSSYSIKDLSYLLVSCLTQSNLSKNHGLISMIKDQIAGHSPPEDIPTQERLALCGIRNLDSESISKDMEEVAKSSNIVEILLNDMLKEKDVKQKQIING